ncbi:MAG TPA: hypothetical protein VK907_02415 [Phnomibacter sp.]|nr:hypothetical protein [Phnomibacter sp.]
MKKFLYTAACTLVLFTKMHAQVSINDSKTAPHASAMLDVSSNNKGMLIPRMTTAQRTAIASPATGLMVFDTQTSSFWYFANGWQEVPKSGGGGMNGAAGGDLGGTFPSPTVTGLMGRVIENAPADHQIIKWNAGANRWQLRNDSLVLPYQAAMSSGAPIFSIKNTSAGINGPSILGRHMDGSGMVGLITSVWGDHTSGAGVAGTSNTGHGLYGASNSGNGGFVTSQTGNGLHAISFQGHAGKFISNGALPTIVVDQSGTGPAMFLNNLHPSSNSETLEVFAQNNNNGMRVITNNGRPAEFLAASVFSEVNAMTVTHMGKGTVAEFNSLNDDNLSSIVKVNVGGTGRGLDIKLNNHSNASPGLNISSNGQKGITVDVKGQFGIYAVTSAANGIGVEGRNNGNNGIGVKGYTFPSLSSPVGVLGENGSGSSFGIGVAGKAALNDTKGIGVYGTNWTSEQDRGAVTGENMAAGVGVYGRSLTNGYGVKGLSTSNNDQAAAIFGENTNGGKAILAHSNGTNPTAILARATPTGGTGYAVMGMVNSGNGTGVAGLGFGTGDGVNGTAGTTGNGIVGSDQLGQNGSRAALFRILTSTGTTDAVRISNAGLATSLFIVANNNSNTQTLTRYRKSGTGDYAIYEDGAQNNKIRLDHNGKGFFNGGTQVGGADMAEAFDAIGNIAEYEPGDVLMISADADRTVVKANEAYSARVAGVYATKPGVLMSEETIDTDLSDKVPMGVLGVIPTKVCGQGGVIQRGDMLVSSSIPGVAMKADPEKLRPGQVIGKALENYTGAGVEKIRVLVNVK